MSSFLWRNDFVGNLIIDDLLDRAAEGIEVRVLIDHWVLMRSQNSIHDRLRELAQSDTAQVRLFNPIVEKFSSHDMEIAWAGMRASATFNRRMHGKLAVFDEAAAIVGGRNIGDEYFDLNRARCFSDAELLIHGPAVPKLRESFEEFWTSPLTVEFDRFDSSDQMGRVQPTPDPVAPDERELLLEIANGSCPDYTATVFEPESVEVVWDKPSVDENPPTATADATLSFMTEAESNLRVTSPMLILEKSWLESLRELRKKRSELVLSFVTNSMVSSDNLYTYAGSLQQRRDLICEASARLYEIRAVPKDISRIIPSYERLSAENTKVEEPPKSGFGVNRFECDELHTTLHAKYAVADDERLLIGSANLDPRSLLCNTEIMLIVQGRQLAEHFADLHDRFRRNRNSWVVTTERRRSLLRAWPRVVLAWHRLTGRGRWPYGGSRCYEPKDTTPEEIPDPIATDFDNRYICCGAYPGVNDSERRVEMVLLASLSAVFRRLL